MAHPKSKTSVSRRNKRRTHHNIEGLNYQICPTTGTPHLPHHAYWSGEKMYYKGRLVIDASEKK